MHLTGNTRRASCCLRPSWRVLLGIFSSKLQVRNRNIEILRARFGWSKSICLAWDGSLCMNEPRLKLGSQRASVPIRPECNVPLYSVRLRNQHAGLQGRSKTEVKQESMTPPTEGNRITTFTQQSKCQAWSVKSKSHAKIESQSQTRWPDPSRGGKVNALLSSIDAARAFMQFHQQSCFGWCNSGRPKRYTGIGG